MNAPAVLPKRGDIYDTLNCIDRGGLTVKLTEGAREAVQAAQRTGKKSKITVEIVFDPDTKTDAMRVVGKIKVALPPEPEKAALFFPTPEGNLVRHDPRQEQMFNETA